MQAPRRRVLPRGGTPEEVFPLTAIHGGVWPEQLFHPVTTRGDTGSERAESLLPRRRARAQEAFLHRPKGSVGASGTSSPYTKARTRGECARPQSPRTPTAITIPRAGGGWPAEGSETRMWSGSAARLRVSMPAGGAESVPRRPHPRGPHAAGTGTGDCVTSARPRREGMCPYDNTDRVETTHPTARRVAATSGASFAADHASGGGRASRFSSPCRPGPGRSRSGPGLHAGGVLRPDRSHQARPRLPTLPVRHARALPPSRTPLG